MITDRIGLHSVLLPLLIARVISKADEREARGRFERKLERVFSCSRARNLHTPSLRCMRQRNDSLRSKRFRRVWEQRKTEERGFRYFACAENGARAKNRTVGVGEGKEGTACGQTPGFWKLPFAGERGSWLAGLVEHFWHVSIKGLKKGEDTFFSKLVYKKR